MNTCPEPSWLKELLDGQLAEAEQDELNRHLETCETCQHRLESLVAGEESWSGAAQQLNETQATPEPALEDAIAGLKGDRTETHVGDGSADEVSLDFLTPTDQPGRLGKLDHYEVIEVVGKGGFGVVLKAFDPELHRHVAIKVLSPHLATSTAARKRFQREATATAAVKNDYVVAIHDVDEFKKLPYLVMEYIAGASLQERLDQTGPLPVNEILRIGMQAARGLAAAHAQGLVHRDIKPANILLENAVERVKITDFGLARAVDDATLTQSGVIAGTPQYMAPEQARGDAVDHRADLFSLGSVLYALCTGRPPFRATTSMAVLKKVTEELPRSIRQINPDIPDWLEAIVGKLHAKDSGQRFQTATEVAELLGQHLAHLQQPGVVPMPATILRSQPEAVGSAHSGFLQPPQEVPAQQASQVVIVRSTPAHASQPHPSGRFLVILLSSVAIALARALAVVFGTKSDVSTRQHWWEPALEFLGSLALAWLACVAVGYIVWQPRPSGRFLVILLSSVAIALAIALAVSTRR